MATIDIKRTHSIGLEEAKKKAENLARDMESELGIKWSWSGNSIKFDAPSGAAKGANGSVDVDGSTVRVQIDLPFLLRAIKGTIESKVNDKLNKALA